MIQIKNIFNTTYIPIIKFSLKDFNNEAKKLVGKLSLSGVQKKVSLKLDRQNKALIIAPTEGEYILKPQLEQWAQVPENEELCMILAEIFGIETAEYTLINLNDSSIAYITKRFDRINNNKIAQEDFCQILGLKTEDKYNGSIEKISKGIKKYSAAPGIDNLNLFRITIFNFLINNIDAHLKNFALLKKENGYRLSPAYDLVNTKLLIPEDKEATTLTINGKKGNLTLKDFKILATNLDLSKKAFFREIARINKTRNIFIKTIKQSQLTKDKIEVFLQLYLQSFSIFKD